MKIYGLKNCTTAKRGKRFLETHGLDFEEGMIDIRENPPSRQAIQLALESANGQIRKIINTSGGLYRELGLKDRLDLMNTEEILDLLAENGMLIKRPLVTDGEKATAGANEDLLKKVWL